MRQVTLACLESSVYAPAGASAGLSEASAPGGNVATVGEALVAAAMGAVIGAVAQAARKNVAARIVKRMQCPLNKPSQLGV